MAAAVMSCEVLVPLGPQIKVSFGGYTDVCVNEARQAGIGATKSGLAVPPPELWISPDILPTAHLEGSRSPPRPRIAEGPSLNVSQKAGELKLQFAVAVNVPRD